MENRTVRDKNLEAIISDILDKSSIRNPRQGRRMDLLRVKRSGASHSKILMKLEEIFKLGEYDKVTGAAFLTHFSWSSPMELCRK